MRERRPDIGHEDYARRYHNVAFERFMPTLEGFRRTRQHVLEWFDDNYGRLLPADTSARVLDVGCGIGEFLYFLRERGYTNIEGADISEYQLDFCRRLVGCEVHHIENLEQFLGTRTDRYDVIYLGDVIEHFSKPQLFVVLDAVRNALRPGGFLLLRTNNPAGIAGLYLRYHSLTHELCFNELLLWKVLVAAGFENVNIFGERLALRWRPRRMAWLLLRKVWFAMLGAIYTIEIGSHRPRVLTRTLLAQAFRK